jgi:cytochrome P450
VAEFEDDVNLTTPAFFGDGDPHAIWRRLRLEDPVHWTQGRLARKFWSITRHADARFVFLNDTRIFSVQKSGANLPMGPEFEDPSSSLFTEMSTTGQQLSVMDGTPHNSLRRYFSDTFSRQGVDGLEQLVRTITNEKIESILERGACDFTTEFAGFIPTAVISAILGIPKERWSDLYRWTNMLGAPEDPEFSVGTPLETNTAAVTNIMETCACLAEEFRGKGQNNLLTVMTLAEVEGKPLTPVQLGFNGLMFFGAGHETTRASMSTGLIQLLRDPAQFDYLFTNRHNPEVLQTAAEEFVRYSSPLTHTLRTATEDTQIGGQEIRKGDWVVVWFHAANRDPAAFPDPERFDVIRTPNQHLGFAAGKHFCLGAHLARLEMRIMLEVMLDRMDDIELAGPVEMSSSNLFWGAKHMPIRFKRCGG